ncbi:K(+)/H(+) antiporter [Borealophlyctis nickersoniae]|nr:K(+)/H(+) antiporter [Borealophlyctis nickersoniae]
MAGTVSESGYVDPGTFLAGSNPLTDQLALFLVQLMIIVLLTRVLGVGLGYINQPRVIAEVIGGILLGPSALCRWGAFKANIFPAASLPKLSLISNFALIFFLFLVGLELDPQSLRKKAKQSAFISLTGIILPFASGVGVSKVIYDKFGDHETVPFYSFLVFCGVAMSITAFPVLARILTERRLLTTPVGRTTLAAAAVDDAVAWTLLVLVVALINNPANAVQAIYVFLAVLAFFAFMWFVTQPILLWVVKRDTSSVDGEVGQFSVFVVFMVVVGSAFFTQAVGVHAIFGGFLAGLVTPHHNGFAIKLTEKIEDLVGILLLPLYFAYSGLNTDVGTLTDGTAWGLTFLIIVVACCGKVIGGTLAARATGFNMRESLAVGVLMNTKGLVELIVLNLGYQAKVINQKVFTMFVIMALVTTFMTVPILSWVYPMRLYMGKDGSTPVLGSTHTLGDGENKDKEVSEMRVGRNPSMEWRMRSGVVICLTNMQTVSSVISLTHHLPANHFSLTAIRLIPLSLRTSRRMMAAQENAADTIVRTDPVINVFASIGKFVGGLRTTAGTNAPIDVIAKVSPVSEFGDRIVETATETDAKLVVVPLSGLQEEDGVMNVVWPAEDDFVRGVLTHSPCSVAVFVDRGFGNGENGAAAASITTKGTSSTENRVIVLFSGGEDDEESALLASNLASPQTVSNTLRLHVLRLTSPSPGSASTLLPDSDYLSTLPHPPTTIHDLPASTTVAAFPLHRGDLVVVGRGMFEDPDRGVKEWVAGARASVVIVGRHPMLNLASGGGPVFEKDAKV